MSFSFVDACDKNFNSNIGLMLPDLPVTRNDGGV
jgi:hypothetical protein